MTFDQWATLMTARLKQQFPNMSVFDRNPGICYAAGVASLDMIELILGRVRIVPHKDALTMNEGQLTSRHKGMTLQSVDFELRDDEFVKALFLIRRHFEPDA